MTSRFLLMLCATFTLTATASAELLAKPIPIEEFGRFADIASVSMSYEGDLISAIVAEPGSNGQRTALATWDLTDPDMSVIVTPANDRMDFWGTTALKGGLIYANTRQPISGEKSKCLEGGGVGGNKVWLTTTRLTDKTHSEFKIPFQANSRNARSVGSNTLCTGIGGTSRLISSLPLDPDHVLVSTYDIAASRTRYYKYNIRTKETASFPTSTPAGTFATLRNPRTGKVMAAEGIEPQGSDWRIEVHLLNPGTGKMERQDPLISLASKRNTVRITGIDEETGNYYIVTDKFSNFDRVYEYNAQTQTFADEPVISHPEFDILGLIFSRREANFNEIIGYRYSGAYITTEWIDPNLVQIKDALEKRFNGLKISIRDWNDNFKQVLFTASHPDGPSSYYVISNFNEIRLLGHSRPQMDDNEFSKTKLVYYTARDGMKIPALLNVPVGWSKKDGPLPTIINPHGGPWARDFGGYDMWTQFFTSRGHAVLRPQYRGSAGFGRELWLAGDGQWGLAMQDDKDDGANWLVSEGIADPNKIAIMGFSYGGYAAIAAVVRPDGPYQCAIAGAGISNLTRLGNNWSSSRLQRAIQGNTVLGMDPIRNTDKADIPALIFHGEYDVRVEPFHSKTFYNRIKDKVHAELIIYDTMGHQFIKWRLEHTRDHLSAMERFLKEDCGPGGLYQ